MESINSSLLDRLFSLYIRLRDTDENGRGFCVTCGKPFPWNQLSCGHFVKRRHNVTRWDEDNCHAQCYPCNIEDNDELYQLKLKQLIGSDMVDQLKASRVLSFKLDPVNVSNKIKIYRAKCRELAKEKSFSVNIP